MSGCDVVFLSHGDWANIGSHLAEALRRVGINARSWAGWHLKMNMPIQSSIYNGWEQVYPDVESAKVVWLMHGYIFKHRHIPIRKDQLVCAYHGGPPLMRMDSGGVHQDFFGRYRRRDLHPVHFIQMPRLYDQCYFLERRHLLSPPVDLDRLQPIYYNGSKRITLGHFPRNTGTGLLTKGHEDVLSVFKSVKRRLPFQLVDTEFINWLSHIERIKKCDVWIEKLSKICPEWGVSALEAAALGKAVVTQFVHRDTYEKEYGPRPIIAANTKEELRKALMELSVANPEELRDIQRKTRAWVEKYHSFEVVGKRLKDILISEGADIG